MRKRHLVWGMLALAGCQKIPEGIQPAGGFELERYLGTWHEIARLDHRFERGMEQITANYSMRDDGGVRVLNRGYLPAKNRWKEAEGKAFFVGARDTGFLKVSFFGPFYGSYVIFDLDRENYGHVFVSGPDRSYLWFLARTPTVPDSLRTRFVTKTHALGFDTTALIWPKPLVK